MKKEKVSFRHAVELLRRELYPAAHPGQNPLIAAIKQNHVGWAKQFGANLFDNEILTVGGELALMATGQKKRFSWRDVLNTALQTAVNVTVAQGLARGQLTHHEGLWLSDLLNSEIGDALSALVYDDRFDAGIAFAKAVGTYAGQRAYQALYEHTHRQDSAWQRTLAEGTRKAYQNIIDPLHNQPEDIGHPYFAQGTGPGGGNPSDHPSTPTAPDDDPQRGTHPHRGASFWQHPGTTGHHEPITLTKQFKEAVYQAELAEAYVEAATKYQIGQHLAQQNSDQGAQATWLMWLEDGWSGAPVQSVIPQPATNNSLWHQSLLWGIKEFNHVMQDTSLGHAATQLSVDYHQGSAHPWLTGIGFLKQVGNLGLDVLDVVTGGPSGLQPQFSITPKEHLGADVANIAAFSLFAVRGSSTIAEAERAGAKVTEGSLKPKASWGNYRPNRKLPRDSRTNLPVPNSDLPHSQIGEVHSKKGYAYTQARTWMHNSDGKLVYRKDIDFTDHTTPDIHPNPHQHLYLENATGGTLRREKIPRPVVFFEDVYEYLENEFLSPKL